MTRGEPVAGTGPASASRRRLLGGIGAAAALGATSVIPLVSRVAASTPPSVQAGEAKRQWMMIVDLRKCEGCVTTDHAPSCVEGCNAEHFVPPGQEWIEVFEIEGAGGHPYFFPRLCMQCENAPCTKVCPVGATYHNDEGVVLVDHDRCIGCRMCMAACPYGVRRFNWEKPVNPAGATFARYTPEYPVPHRQGTVSKCMMCAHLVKDGKLPACADACPMFAIYLGDYVQDVATNGVDVVKVSRFLAEHNAYRIKEELGTHPRVWYIPGHGQEYGHTVDSHGEMKEPRSWVDQGVELHVDDQGNQHGATPTPTPGGSQ